MTSGSVTSPAHVVTMRDRSRSMRYVMGIRAPELVLNAADYPAEADSFRLLEVAGDIPVPGLLPDELAVLPQLPRALVPEVLAIAREHHHALPPQDPAGKLDLDRVLAAHRRLLRMPVLGLVRELLGIALLAPGVAVGALVVRDDGRLPGARVAVDRGDLAVRRGRLHREGLVARQPPPLPLRDRKVARGGPRRASARHDREDQAGRFGTEEERR